MRGEKSQRGVAKSYTAYRTVRSNYIMEEHLKWHFLSAKLVKSSLQKKNA